MSSKENGHKILVSAIFNGSYPLKPLRMPHDLDQDMIALREWLAKEPYLPQDFEDIMLKKFIHSCNGSMEKAKKCLEKFCTYRSSHPEIYSGRDVLSPKLQTAFSITNVTNYEAGDVEILVHQLDDPGLEKMVFYDLVRAFTLQGDHWLRVQNFFPRGHVIVLDIKDYSLKIITKVNVVFFIEYLLFLLEGVPVKVVDIHVVNCPSYYDKLYCVVKNALPAEIRDMIKFHSDAKTLLNYYDKKYLPSEYGGEAQSMKDQQNYWVKELVKQRDFYRNDNLWKADLMKKPKGAVENSMSGTFRTLSID